MILFVVLQHPSPPQPAWSDPANLGKGLVLGKEISFWLPSQSHGSQEIPTAMAHLFGGKSLTDHYQTVKELPNDLGGFPESPKPAWSFRKCKGGEMAAENYWAWGKEWILAMLTSIIKGMIYVFQKWLFGKIWCSAVLGPNWRLSCIIRHHLRDTAAPDLTENSVCLKVLCVCVFKKLK